MTFELFIPYIKGASLDIKDNMNGYYKNEHDYADALVTEDSSNGAIVYDAMRDETSSNTYYTLNSWGNEYIKKEDKISFAKAECILLTSDASDYETVDSIIDRFVSQREFLITAHFNMPEMEGEFEEELREWAKETLNILLAGREIIKKGGSRNESDEFVEENIPRRQLRLSFLNKSGKRVSFVLNGCEIEQKIAKNRYLFYVKNMQMLK
jgi:hypothetical protein